MNVKLRNIFHLFFFCIICCWVFPVYAQENPSIISMVHYKFDPLKEQPDIPDSLLAIPDPIDENYYIVQFQGPIQNEWKKEVTDLGGKIFDYVNHFAFVVKMDEITRWRVEKLPFVRWVGMFHPAYKLDPNLGKNRFNPDDSKWTLILSFFRDVDTAKVLKKIKEIGGKSSNLFYFPQHRIVRMEVYISPDKIDELAAIPEVKWITHKAHKELKNHSTCFFVQKFSGGTIPAAGDTSIWAKGIHGEGQIIGFGDTGLDYDHCAFRDPAHLESFGSSHRKIIRNQAYGTGAELYDAETDGHGSHVCGTAAGDQSYITGSTYDNGIAYKAKISFADIVSCAGSFSNFAFLTVLNDAYSDGARIHSNSWGYDSGTEGNYYAEAVDADAFMWDNKDMLVLFANGNDGPTYRVEPPATAKDIVSVGATGGTNNSGYNYRDENEMTDYSCPGPTDDGRRKPTITAPGHFIQSVDNDDGDCCGTGNCAATCNYEYLTNGGYIWTGTSMACPAAAGCAALVRQYFTEGWYPNGAKTPSDAFTPSAALIKAMLINGALDMSGESSWPTDNQGFGRVELEDVLYFSGDSRVLNIVDETSGFVNSGQADTHYFQVGNSEPLEITLVWTDHEAAEYADPAIVNDLDLRVEFGGNVYLGNVFSSRQSTTGGSYDRLNVEEEVLLKTPPAAECTVIVYAYEISYGPQPYAIVVTGDLPCNHPPDAPTLTKLFDNERMQNTTPTFEWNVPADDDGDNLDFKVQIDDDADFSSPFATIESKNNTSGFSPTTPVAEGSGTCSYTIGSQGEGSLTNGTTYYWRVAAYDNIVYGDWSSVRSFTVNTAQTESDWFQTKQHQFETDILNGIQTNGDAVELATNPGSTEELYWDDGGTECMYWSTPYYFACLYQPASPCTIKTAKFYVNRSALNTAASCTLFIWEYTGSNTPGAVVYGPVAFRPSGSGWYSIDLPSPYYDSDGQFWIGAFFPNKQNNLRYLYLCGEDNAPINEKTYYSSSRTGSWSHDAGYDDYIRAIIRYEDVIYSFGTITSTPISYSDNPGTPTSWDKVEWTENDGDSIRIAVQYRNSGSWANFSDTGTVLSGTDGELDISSLGTTDTIRVIGLLYRKGGSSPTLFDWAVKWKYSTIGVQLLVGDASGPDYGTWALGNIDPGTVKIMNANDRVYVKNTSSQAIDVSIQASPIAWTYSDAAGADRCVLMALFNGTDVPTESDFSTSYDTLGTNDRAAGVSPDGKFAGANNDGVNIPAGSGEELYMYFKAPNPNTQIAEQDITVTITAVAH